MFEDTEKSETLQSTLRVDYLIINVTISPFWAIEANLTYENGSALEQGGLNFTRTDALNISVRWNASDYSVISGTVILNNSNSGEEEEYNISLMSDFINFSGNWTNYTINLTNSTLFDVGGNWTVKMRAWDSFYQQNTSTSVDFGLWAYANVSEVTTNQSGNQTLGNRQILLRCRVLDNESEQPVNQHNVSFWNESAYIGSALTNSTGWATKTYTEANTALLNYTIICNITNQPEILYNTSEDNSQSLTLEIITDSVAPIINSLEFQYRGLTTNITNLYANMTIQANITDNSTNATDIKTVKVNITYPDGEIVEGTMWQNSSSTDMWSIFFNTTNDEMPINATGIYGVNVSAWDLSDNLAHADWNNYSANFTAYSHLNVTMEYRVDNTTSYNRGEKLTLYARDVNGIIMTNLNWTVNITRYNEIEVNLSDASGVNNYTLSANVSDPTGNWSIEVINVTGSDTGVNEGNETFIFNITRTLTPYFLPDLYADRSYGLSQDVNSVTPIYVRVNYSRGANTNYTMNVNLSYSSTNHSMNRSGTPTYYNSTMIITSPGSYSTYFTLWAYAGDDYNNTGSGSIRLVTSAQPSSNIVNSGGGGGYTEVVVNVTLNASCNCTGWGNVGCSIGGCGVNDMYQERVCTPSGCGTEGRCLVNYSACISLVKDFNITTDKTDVVMKSGESETITITLFNTGETNLSINVSVEKNCCDASFLNKVINLSEQASLDIPLAIHSRLLENPGSYIITVKAQWEWLEKTKAIRVKVSRNPFLAEVDRLEEELSGLEAQIAEYKISGVYIAGLENRTNSIRQVLDEAKNSIASDKLNVLEQRLESASSGLNDVKGGLSGLVLQKVVLDNKWWIVLGAIVAIFASYLIAEVVIPVHRLTKEIRKLSGGEKEMVQKRKEIEKQYFMGKIREQAFNDMLIGEQGKILGARGKAIKMANERKLLLKTKLSPRGMFNWLRAGPKGLVRRIRDLGRRLKRLAKQPKNIKKKIQRV